jgi:hypothetical protein
VAWINAFDANGASLYSFDLNKKSGCQLAVAGAPNGFSQVGMGFSADAVGSTSETLYVDSVGGSGLAKVDMNSKTIVPIGPFSNDPALVGQSAELTGTADARLFAYFTTMPNVRIAQIDKASAAILSDDELMGVPPPQDWAFAFWGGEFYLFAASPAGMAGNSSVIRFNPTTKALDTAYVPDVGFVVVGAGATTCEPLL